MENTKPLTDSDRVQAIREVFEKACKGQNEGVKQSDRLHCARAPELHAGGRQGPGAPCVGAECENSGWHSVRQMQKKKRASLNSLSNQLGVLESTTAHSKLSSNEGAAVREPPPAYTPQAMDEHLTISRGTKEGEQSLIGNTDLDSPASPQCLVRDGQELLFIPRGVQIYFVAPNGEVSAPSCPGHLRIIRRTNQVSDAASNSSPSILQVCDWIYNVSIDTPVLQCSSGFFMFPDTSAVTPGSYVGVVLSSELPDSDREMLQDQLSQLTDLRVQTQTCYLQSPELERTMGAEGKEEKSLPEWSEKVSHGILTGASWLSWGLVKGAEYTEKAIHKGASKLREHITPEDTPTSVARGFQVAKQATGGAVKVSQYLVGGVCTVASCMGRELAPHVKKHGSKLVPESLKSGNGHSNIDGAMKVAASGMQGLATVWSGLELASMNIGKSVASETVSTMKHKFRGIEDVLDPPCDPRPVKE